MPSLGSQRPGVDLLGPPRELRGVFERHARDAADHLHRIHRRDRRDEIGAPERRDRVEQPVDRRAHERLVPALELRRAERLGDEVAVRAVLGAVHREDEVAHELPDVLGVDRRRERVGVAEHGLGVRVAQHLVARARPEHPRARRDDRAVRLPGPRPRRRRAGRAASRRSTRRRSRPQPRPAVDWSAMLTSGLARVPDTVVRYKGVKARAIAPMLRRMAKDKGARRGGRKRGRRCWARRRSRSRRSSAPPSSRW